MKKARAARELEIEAAAARPPRPQGTLNGLLKQVFVVFYAGTKALTAGSWSCNFGCPWCQNWDISKSPPPAKGDYLFPERFIASGERTPNEA